MRVSAAADIAVPASVVFTPIDLEHQSLAEGLAASGFAPTQHTFFTWLGVVPYLSEEAALATLALIASLSGGAHVVFDYANPPQAMSDAARAAHDELAARALSVGEMFRTYWETEPLHARLCGLGYRQIEDLSPVEIVARFLPGRVGIASDRGGHMSSRLHGSVDRKPDFLQKLVQDWCISAVTKGGAHGLLRQISPPRWW
jgi:methyltransferase (TIGR00027 family)